MGSLLGMRLTLSIHRPTWQKPPSWWTQTGKAPITGNYWAEGPTTLKLGNNWIVYFDKYRDHKYGAVQSPDLKTWLDVSDKIALPKGIRHGSIFTITRKELEQLVKEM